MLAILSLAVIAATPASSPWAALARADIVAARDAIRENHPGPVDTSDPGFGRRMDEGYAAAVERADKAISFDGYAAAVRSFAAVFHDGHLGISMTVARHSLRWPGFLPALRGQRYVVRAAEGDDAPPAGTEIVSCDGRPLEDWMRRDVFPFAPGARPDVQSSWVRLAPQVLVDAGNPFRARAARCLISTAGVTREVELAWRDIDRAALEGRMRQAAWGEAPAFAVRDFGEGGLWVSMPSFAPDSAGEAELHRMIAAAPSWRTRRALVLDVRGNTGGSSVWGHDLLQALFGAVPEPADAAVYVEWRVSSGNQRHVEAIAARLGEQFGPDASVAAGFRQIADGLLAALRRGQSLYREPDEPAPASLQKPPGRLDETALKLPVFLLTDGRCASACDDFVDMALRYPNVVHVGAATDVDSPYMEIRPVPLPSGIATLNLATKVYRNRPRTGKPFVPVHAFDGELSDTAALERWIAALRR